MLSLLLGCQGDHLRSRRWNSSKQTRTDVTGQGLRATAVFALLGDFRASGNVVQHVKWVARFRCNVEPDHVHGNRRSGMAVFSSSECSVSCMAFTLPNDSAADDDVADLAGFRFAR